jgi:ATP-dependent exoDNAse (exonuclease V) alpha subunit
MVDIATQLSPELVNRKQFYVSISRARHGISIYTDDRAQLSRAVNRNREKSLALEHQQRIGAPAHRIIPDEPRQSIRRGHGMRM